MFAGLYAVIEAWINAKATNSNRGALYALYQIANFVASASGQMALKPLGPGGFSPFAVAGGAARARDRADGDDQRRSARPAAKRAPPPHLARPRWRRFRAVAVLAAGAANGALFALGPVFAVEIGMTPSSVPLFTSSIVLGSALGVLPIARRSPTASTAGWSWPRS